MTTGANFTDPAYFCVFMDMRVLDSRRIGCKWQRKGGHLLCVNIYVLCMYILLERDMTWKERREQVKPVFQKTR